MTRSQNLDAVIQTRSFYCLSPIGISCTRLYDIRLSVPREVAEMFASLVDSLGSTFGLTPHQTPDKINRNVALMGLRRYTRHRRNELTQQKLGQGVSIR